MYMSVRTGIGELATHARATAHSGRARLSLRTAHQLNLISPLPARVPLTVDAFIALP